ncbi:MAG: hypothetical protein AVDCRST_MAG93-2686 [uncultured Chloroflexia bacterium]|uniref:Uncharacterized protein n=1 Tax=uncultured Chloroflexia bacterium TaxID=1672391 RepID=A0A6J4JBG7_9CHLR|nr:MAG: hypothetical protein AVDCRST_MAG93-2686 [uncultured Chloroflexia bacterium]
MAQLDSKGIGNAEQGWLRQEQIGQVGMSIEQAKQACALRQIGKIILVVAGEPGIEGTWSETFEGEKQAEGDDLTGIEAGLRMFRMMMEHLVNTDVETNDTIDRRHAHLLDE